MRHIDWKPWVSKLSTRHESSVFVGRDEELTLLNKAWMGVVEDQSNRSRLISLVAIGGAGKTTLVSRWKQSLLDRVEHGGVECYFDWSFYTQGTGDDSSEGHTASSAEPFIREALRFFDDDETARSNRPAWDKGARLAELIGNHHTLLILDGIEPLQQGPGPQQGDLKDEGLRALLSGLAQNGRSLCVVTTRYRLTDFMVTEESTTPRYDIGNLSETAGAEVLSYHGVVGPRSEMLTACREVKGHALTLTLMGRFLRMAYPEAPDIAKRDCFHFQEADAKVQNGHAFRVFAAYEEWFDPTRKPIWQAIRRWLAHTFRIRAKPTDGQIAAAILRLLGLFDRPATPDCLAALCTRPAIAGLTDPLVGLNERDWNVAISRLEELHLIDFHEWIPLKACGYGEDDAKAIWAAQDHHWHDIGTPKPFENHQAATTNRRSLDAHPLLREYFANQLLVHMPRSRRTAHERLFGHLCASVPYWPEGQEGLQPLYQAVAHGCQAGLYRKACDNVYHDRINRGASGTHAFYSIKMLGLFGQDLAALACFFVEPWKKLTPELHWANQAWLLNAAASNLRSMNRLAEAREPMRVSMEISVNNKEWYGTAVSACNISQLELTLGDVPAATAIAAQSVIFADRSDDTFQRIIARVTHADALHMAGCESESETILMEAERIQAENQPFYPLLYSVQGYHYCDLLLAAAERASRQTILGPQHDLAAARRLIEISGYGRRREELELAEALAPK